MRRGRGCIGGAAGEGARRAAAGLLAGAFLLAGSGAAHAQTINPDGSATIFTGELILAANTGGLALGYFSLGSGSLTPDSFTFDGDSFDMEIFGISENSCTNADNEVADALVAQSLLGADWGNSEARWVLHLDSHTFDFADAAEVSGPEINWCDISADDLGWADGDTVDVKITRKAGTPISVPDGHPVIWQVDITPGIGSGTSEGDEGWYADTYGRLTGPVSFRYKDGSYEIRSVYTGSGNTFVEVSTGSTAATELAHSGSYLSLHVGSLTLALSGATGGTSVITWLSAEIIWPDGAIVGISTSEPGAPGDLSAEVASDTSVTLGWSAPEKMGGSAITGYEYRRSADEGENWGSWTTIDNSASLTEFLVKGLHADTTYTFQMRAVNDSGSGLFSESALQQAGNSGPTISSLALSDAGTDSAYAIGDTVSVTVTFSDSVEVTGGPPHLDIDVDGSPETLTYDSGSGTPALVFTGYVVAENDEDTDGIAIDENSLDLNGGTIHKKDSTTVTADITHAAVAADPARKVDGVRPTLSSAATSSDGTQIVLTFSETLTAGEVAADSFAVMVASSVRHVYSASASGASVTLTLQSAVGTGQAVTVAYTDPSTDDDTDAVEDAAGNDAATFSAETVTNNSSVPVIFPARGDTIWAVDMIVGVEAELIDGADTRTAGYLATDSAALGRISGSAALIHDGTTYTVQSVGTATLIYFGVLLKDGLDFGIAPLFPTSPDDPLILDLDGTVFRLDQATRHTSSTKYTWDSPGLTWTEGQTVAVKLIAASPPSVASVSVVDAPSGNTYAIGDTIHLGVTFTKDVTLDTNGGTPELEFTVGDSTRTATCPTASGNQLACMYQVDEGIEGGIGVAPNKLTLEGGTLTGPYGQSADTTYTADEVSIDASLGVDGVRPTFVSAATSFDGTQILLTFNETLSSATAPGSAFAVVVADTARTVDQVEAGDTTVTLTLATTVATGQTVTVAYTDPSANNDGSAVQDAAGNDAATFAAQSVTNRVDVVAPTLVTSGDGAPKTSADGGKVLLTFSEALSAAAAPTSAFTVTVASSERGVSSVFASGLSAAAPSVTLVLASPVATGDAVTVAYSDPSADDDSEAVQDAAGNDAATFAAQTVTNSVQPATEGEVLWSVDMTADVFILGDIEGYLAGFTGWYAGFVGSISGSAQFSYGETNYTVVSVVFNEEVTFDEATREVFLGISPLFPAAPDDLLILALDGTEFRLDEANTAAEGYEWALADLTWSDGEPVAVKLIAVPPPSVTSIAVVDAPSNNTYAIGDTVDLAVTFSKDVTLDVTDGTPELEFTVGDSTRTATCGAASGTQLTCMYQVAEGIAGRIGVAANKLTLEGGTLTGSDGRSADTTYTADEVSIDAALRVDGIRPTLLTTGGDAPRTSPDGAKVILTFSETLSSTTAPGSAFAVVVADTARTVQVEASGTAVTLTLASVVVAIGQTVTVAYTDPSADDDENAVQDAAGNDAATFGVQSVVNRVPSKDASLSALSLSGVTLTPAFHTDSLNYTATVANSVSSTTVTPTTSHDSAKVAYFDGSDAALTDADAAAGFQVALDVGTDTIKVKVTAQDGVTQKTYALVVTREAPPPAPVVSSLALSDAGTDGAYAIGDTVSVTVTFSDSVDVTNTPQLDIDVDGSDETLNYDSGTGTRELVFTGYVVAENDEDTNGIEIDENALDVNDGTIRRKGTTVDATITHAAVAADATRKVDGVRPTLSSAATSSDGTRIVLTFSETLSGTTAPADAFTVMVASSERGVHSVSASGTSVTLTLQSAAGTGQAVTVAYTDPTTDDDDDAVEDAAGNDAATFAAETVTNNSTVPVIFPARGDTIWAADMTVGQLTITGGAFVPTFTGYGSDRGYGRISGSAGLSHDETNHTVEGVFIEDLRSGGTLISSELKLAMAPLFPAAPANVLVLDLDGTRFRLDQATRRTEDYTWTTHALTWTEGATVSAKLIAVSAPSITSIADVEAPSRDLYAIGDTIHLGVTFSKGVTLDTNGGTPELELTVGDSTRTATCPTATGMRLTCLYQVAEGIQGNIGVAANKLTLQGGTLTGPYGQSADTTYTADVVSIDASLWVDGIRPTLVTSGDDAPMTTADGTQIVLTFSEPLATTTAPESAFAVTVDAAPRTVTDVAATRSGTVSLVLESAVTAGEEVTVAYTDPSADNDTDAVQDEVGNDAETFGAQPVANRVPSMDASLSALSLSGVALTPAFHADSTSYTGSAPHSVAMTTVTATPAEASAAVDYLDGADQALADADAADGFQVALDVGTDTIKVRVTAQDEVTRKTYTVVVTRHEEPATGVTLSVVPDELGEGAGQTMLTVTGTLNGGAFTENRTVALSVSPGTASASDFTAGTAALTIDAGETSGTATLSLTPVDDRIDEDDETVTVTGTASGLTVTGAEVTITDDDTRGVRVPDTSVEFGEGGSGTYTVVLESQPTATVTVGISVAGDSDVTVFPPSLEFTTGDWSTVRTVTVSAAHDADAADDTAMVSHTVSGGDYGANGVTAASVSVSVADDDEPSTGVALSVSPDEVGEGAGQTALSVTGTLNGAAFTEDKAVSLSVSAGTASASDFTAGTATLTILAGQTAGTATLMLTPVDDDVDEDDETVTVTGTAQGLTVTGAAVTIGDDDTRGVSVSKSALSIGEGESGTYTVALESEPTATVTIAVSVSGDADVTVDPETLEFTTGNWDAPRTVTVSAAQDDDEEGDEATVSHAVSGGDYGAAGVTARSVTVRVADDDISLEFKANVSRLREGEETRLWVYTNGTTFETDQTITLALAGTATAGTDYTLSEPNITIEAGSTSGGVTLAALEDSESEDDETIVITASHGTAEIGTITITIADGTVEATVPDAPVGLAAVPGSREVALSWTAPQGQAGFSPYNGGSPVTRHEYRLDGGSWRAIPNSGEDEENEEKYTVTGLENDREYRFAVRAVNAVGPGAASREVRATPSDGICGRTPQVRDAIMAWLSGSTGCGGVTADDLASISGGIYVNDLDIASLKAGDFDGLTAVPEVDLSRNRLSSLPARIFDDLAALTRLNLDGNRLASLPAGVFDGLALLKELDIDDNGLRSLRTGVFDRLAALEELDLRDNELASFPYEEINELAELRRLRLNGNPVYRHGVVVSETALTIAPGGSGTYRVRLNHHPPSGAAVEPKPDSAGVTAAPTSLSYGNTDWFRYKEVTVSVAQNATASSAAVAHKVVNYGPPGMETPSVTITIQQSSGDAAGTGVAERDSAEHHALLALLDRLTPEQASEALFGERTLSEAQLDALDRLGNRNGRYDLGDLLSWTERCRRGEASCGRTPKGPGAASPGLLLFGGGAAGRRRRSGRGRGREAGRRRTRGPMLAVLLAAATAWSCTGDLAGPPAAERDPSPQPAAATAPRGPGFLAIEWTAPAGGRAIGVLLELEGPGSEDVRAPGLELYHWGVDGRHRIVVAGSFATGTLVRFRVPDRRSVSLYTVRVLQVTGRDYGLRDPTAYRAVISPP